MKYIKYIFIERGYIYLLVGFLLLFFLYAGMFDFISIDSFIDRLFIVIPESVWLSVFLGIYYAFIFPVTWTLEELGLFQYNNVLMDFGLIIGLTIIYLTLLFFLVRGSINLLKKRKKTSKRHL